MNDDQTGPDPNIGSETQPVRQFSIGASSHIAGSPAPGLYLVSTPIGNLDDITLRALKILGGANHLYCEDTRQTRRLLDRYGISRHLATYHEHNAEAARRDIATKLCDGASIALVSDAGTPLISDPGFKLVREVAEAGHKVFPVPGPSALLSAVVAAGLPTDHLHFHGFLPPKQVARRKTIASLVEIDATLIFYEAPGRAAKTLTDLAEILGPRPAALARELTKLHEEISRDSLDVLATKFGETPPRGEVVLVVGGAADDQDELSDQDVDGMIREALNEKSLRDAVASVTARTGLKKRDIYARALEISQDSA